MKRFNKLMSLVLALMLVVSLAACGGEKEAPPAAEGDAEVADETVYHLRYATNMKEGDDLNSATIALKEFEKYIEEKSEGRLDLQIYWGGTLGSSAEDVIGGCQNGAFEMFSFAHGNWGDYTDAMWPFNVPYLFQTQEQVVNFINSEGYEEVAQQVIDDTAIRVLGMDYYGFRNMTSNKGVIKSPADMVGLKLRTMTDPYQIAAMEALGATPTPIAWAECFSALQQGVVDAQENPLVNIYSNKLFEVQKYMTFTQHNVSATTIAINENYFQSLPADLQQILIDGGKLSEDVCVSTLNELEEELIEKLQSDECGNMVLYWPTPEEMQVFQDTVRPSWDVIREKIGPDRFDAMIEIVDSCK